MPGGHPAADGPRAAGKGRREAFHGDLGMMMRGDVALMISNSGETEELIRVLPFLEAQRIPVPSVSLASPNR